MVENVKIILPIGQVYQKHTRSMYPYIPDQVQDSFRCRGK